jgi:hypothetical protein
MLTPGSRKQASDARGAVCTPGGTRDCDQGARVVASTRQMETHVLKNPARQRARARRRASRAAEVAGSSTRSGYMVADGAMNGVLFLKYVQECLARYCTPTTSSLRTTYVGTKWRVLKRPLKRSGHTSAIFRRIPQNPIEKRFAILNALLRKAAP